MAVPATIPAGGHVPTADQRLVMHCVPWSHFEAQLALRGERYEQVARSRLLPGLDVVGLTTYLEHPTALRAVKAFREDLRKSSPARRPARPSRKPRTR